MFEIGRFLRPAALLFAAVMLTLPVADATAGCLSEYNACTDCARSAMAKAVRSLNPGAVNDAHIQLLDCSIDVWHCVLFASHHDYPCAV